MSLQLSRIERPPPKRQAGGSNPLSDAENIVENFDFSRFSAFFIFEYQPERGGKYPESFLKDYEGYIHTDACCGYNGILGVKRCLCYAHLRRTFVDASGRWALFDQKFTFYYPLFETISHYITQRRKNFGSKTKGVAAQLTKNRLDNTFTVFSRKNFKIYFKGCGEFTLAIVSNCPCNFCYAHIGFL